MYGVVNAEVIIQENISRERLVDAIIGNRVFIPSLILVNKIDLIDEREIEKLNKFFKLQGKKAYFISSLFTKYMHKVKEAIYSSLSLLRVYMKEPGKEPDMEEPLILRKGTKIKDIAERLKIKGVRYAKVWGNCVKFPGQRVGEQYEVCDEDIIELKTEK